MMEPSFSRKHKGTSPGEPRAWLSVLDTASPSCVCSHRLCGLVLQQGLDQTLQGQAIVSEEAGRHLADLLLLFLVLILRLLRGCGGSHRFLRGLGSLPEALVTIRAIRSLSASALPPHILARGRTGERMPLRARGQNSSHIAGSLRARHCAALVLLGIRTAAPEAQVALGALGTIPAAALALDITARSRTAPWMAHGPNGELHLSRWKQLLFELEGLRGRWDRRL